MPTGPNGKKLPWKFDVLPAIPEHFELEPIEQSAARLKQVLKLARRKDVDLIVNACDAGREGELIFRYIMDIGKINKPVKRLWMQSMTTGAILEAWEHLRSDEEMQPLADAARCRSESDWLVGLNATRALTCFRSRHGGFNITSAGRVQTPTLAILAKREPEIQAFKPDRLLRGPRHLRRRRRRLPRHAGSTTAWKKDPAKPHGRRRAHLGPRARRGDQGPLRGQDRHHRGEKETLLPDRAAALRPHHPAARGPVLRQGHPADRPGALREAQDGHLPADRLALPARGLHRHRPRDHGRHRRLRPARRRVRQGRTRRQGRRHRAVKSKRIFNTAKVSDHFAIIPTGRVVKLSDAEAKLYDMIVQALHRRLLPARRVRANHPPHPHRSLRPTRTPTDATPSRPKAASSSTPAGSPSTAASPASPPARTNSSAVAAGESAATRAIEVLDEETKPPARFTESTLLSAMEGAGKLVDDEELGEAMSERGLGTPATRAAIIEGPAPPEIHRPRGEAAAPAPRHRQRHAPDRTARAKWTSTASTSPS